VATVNFSLTALMIGLLYLVSPAGSELSLQVCFEQPFLVFPGLSFCLPLRSVVWMLDYSFLTVNKRITRLDNPLNCQMSGNRCILVNLMLDL